MLTKVHSQTDWALSLKGPIIVLGAGGFVGANLFRRILASRSDVFAVARKLPLWRLSDIDDKHLLEVEMTNNGEVRSLIDYVKPATVFDCISYGAYSFETDAGQIYETNFLALVRLTELLRGGRLAAFIHAGSSSEYGLNCAAPTEFLSITSEQSLRRLQDCGEQLHQLCWKNIGRADRQSTAVLGLWSLRRCLAVDPQRCAAGPEGRIPAAGQSRYLP